MAQEQKSIVVRKPDGSIVVRSPDGVESAPTPEQMVLISQMPGFERPVNPPTLPGVTPGQAGGLDPGAEADGGLEDFLRATTNATGQAISLGGGFVPNPLVRYPLVTLGGILQGLSEESDDDRGILERAAFGGEGGAPTGPTDLFGGAAGELVLEGIGDAAPIPFRAGTRLAAHLGKVGDETAGFANNLRRRLIDAGAPIQEIRPTTFEPRRVEQATMRQAGRNSGADRLGQFFSGNPIAPTPTLGNTSRLNRFRIQRGQILEPAESAIPARFPTQTTFSGSTSGLVDDAASSITPRSDRAFFEGSEDNALRQLRVQQGPETSFRNVSKIGRNAGEKAGSLFEQQRLGANITPEQQAGASVQKAFSDRARSTTDAALREMAETGRIPESGVTSLVKPNQVVRGPDPLDEDVLRGLSERVIDLRKELADLNTIQQAGEQIGARVTPFGDVFSASMRGGLGAGLVGAPLALAGVDPITASLIGGGAGIVGFSPAGVQSIGNLARRGMRITPHGARFTDIADDTSNNFLNEDEVQFQPTRRRDPR